MVTQQVPPGVGGLALDDVAVHAFQASVRGEVIRPGDDGYDAARQIWNGMIQKTPALIVRCAGVADVLRAVEFAHAQQLLVAVRGGGHNVAGNAVCDGGMVIDLSPMKGVRVDPATATATAQAGLTLGEFDRETQAFGLATTGGIVATTGLAGLTLGGGVGWLMGKYGLTCDNLLSADVVTADGRFLTASADEHADLFWGLRGGGGNFGIATSFRYRLHEVGPVVAGLVLHPAERARDVLRCYREFTAAAPDELTAYAGFLTTPDGQPAVALALCSCGPVAEGERLVGPIRQFGPPMADLIQPMPYVAAQSLFGAAVPFGQQSYWKSNQLAALSDEAIETLAAYGSRLSSPRSVVMVEHHHGAVGRADPAATAFAHRSAPYDLVIVALWRDPSESETHIRWTRAFWQAMRPHFAGGVYVNAMSQDEGADRVRAAYGASYDRLAALKAKYDPTNFFRLNQNIPPAG